MGSISIPHTARIAVIWIVASALVELLIANAPIPSPTGSPEALGEHQTIDMLFYVGAPIFVLIWLLFLYAIVITRRRPGEEEVRAASGEPTPILLLWAGVSLVIVLFLAGWGTFTLHEMTAPPRPWANTGKSFGSEAARPLVIQVIARQWLWTFRYPAYAGMETRDLVVPYNTPIRFHITSLDVVHSLWIYEYDVKEDAVPGVDNEAWLLAGKYGRFTVGGTNWVKCNELCGVGHSYMETGIYVKSPSNFVRWARGVERLEKSIHLLARLPKYSPVYDLASPSLWPPPPPEPSPSSP